MSARISVIVPVYKAEKYLNRCIDSILAQTFTDFELILVDDGSPDNCGAICDEYAEKDSRIKVIHKENGGVSSARNAGLDIAKGEFIVFIDSDDSVDETYLETLYQKGKYDFVTAGFLMQGPDNSWNKLLFTECSTDNNDVRLHPSDYMGKYYFGAPWAKLFRKEIIDRYNIRFDLNVRNGEDTIFIFDFLNHVNNIKIIEYCGYNYYFYKNSLAHIKQIENFKWRIQVEQKVTNYFNSNIYNEILWLQNRCFSVLEGQVKEHYSKEYKDDVYSLYYHDVFKGCIERKKKRGNLKERFFIFTMEHSLYPLYLLECKFENFCKRVKNKIKRTFKI